MTHVNTFTTLSTPSSSNGRCNGRSTSVKRVWSGRANVSGGCKVSGSTVNYVCIWLPIQSPARIYLDSRATGHGHGCTEQFQYPRLDLTYFCHHNRRDIIMPVACQHRPHRVPVCTNAFGVCALMPHSLGTAHRRPVRRCRTALFNVCHTRIRCID
jgi:hypothetical protein